MEDAKKNLDDQDSKLAAFKSRYLNSLPDEEQTNLNLLTGLTSQLDAATQALSRAQQDKSFAESLLTQQIGAWQASQSGTGASPDTLEQQLAALETQLTSLQARYTDDYPDVIKTKNDIALLRKKIAENGSQKTPTDPNKVRAGLVEPAQITQLRAQIHSYEQVIAEKAKEQETIKEQIKGLRGSSPIEPCGRGTIQGTHARLSNSSRLLQRSVEETDDDAVMAQDLQHEQAGEQFRVLDPANLPDEALLSESSPFCVGRRWREDWVWG